MESGEGRGLPDDTGTQTQPAIPPESDREQRRNRAYLVVLAGVSAGEMFKITAEKTLIGRGAHVSLRITDDGVSREHCQLLREGDRIMLDDLGSTNGTFCNGVRVDRRELVDGDKIMVGSTTILKFTYQDQLDEAFQRQMYESALRDGLTKVFNRQLLHRPPGQRSSRTPCATRRRWRCCSSTSITSRRSTTPTAIRRATSCCRSCRRC